MNGEIKTSGCGMWEEVAKSHNNTSTHLVFYDFNEAKLANNGKTRKDAIDIVNKIADKFCFVNYEKGYWYQEILVFNAFYTDFSKLLEEFVKELKKLDWFCNSICMFELLDINNFDSHIITNFVNTDDWYQGNIVPDTTVY
jgi:hypothetical protein